MQKLRCHVDFFTRGNVYGGGMVSKKIAFCVVILSVFSAVPVWALEGAAGEAVGVIGTGQQVPARVETVASAPARTEKSGVTEPSDNSWWSAVTDTLGLTDSDPGVIVQPVTGRISSSASDYIIGPGDMIGVSVWKDDNLTRTVVVLPDGKISLPLVGELVAEGKTVAQFKQEVEKALSRYTADSTVTVEVKQLNSMFIYVIGRVNSPGRQALVANTNVLQALAMVGGPNPFAKSSKIKIFRQHEGETAVYSFNYNDVMEGRHLETNIELKRGDVIIVP
jgi:polysaccharide biosynthesis/export protein